MTTVKGEGGQAHAVFYDTYSGHNIDHYQKFATETLFLLLLLFIVTLLLVLNNLQLVYLLWLDVSVT